MASRTKKVIDAVASATTKRARSAKSKPAAPAKKPKKVAAPPAWRAMKDPLWHSDGKPRCAGYWAVSKDNMIAYHDKEWGTSGRQLPRGRPPLCAP